jgi:hypothetical protein
MCPHWDSSSNDTGLPQAPAPTARPMILICMILTKLPSGANDFAGNASSTNLIKATEAPRKPPTT